MRVWHNSLVHYLRPLERDLCQLTVVSLESDLEHSPQQSGRVLDNVSHVRYETECLDLPILEISFQQAENLRVRLIEARLVNLDNCALGAELLHFLVLLFPGVELLELRGLSQIEK